ncbi:sarcosine oxidasee (formaldehyde-forming) [Sarracenia purpurea var. burkii]
MENSGDQFDVIVVGAGIMGSSTTYQIAKRGHRVLLLEQFDFLHHRGSSHGESRTIRAAYPEEYYSAMVMESVRLWEEAESEIGYKVYFKTSHLDMGPANNEILRAITTNFQLNAIPHRVLDPSQVHEEFSGKIELPENWIGVLSEIGGVVKPTKAVSMFQTLALKNGAVLKDNMKVSEMEREDVRGGILVCTENGERFWGKKCVVTVGAWMKTLVKRVTGMVLPIQPLETSAIYWRIKEGHDSEFTIGSGFPTFASYGDPSIYGTPSLEFPGLIKIPPNGGQPCNPERRTWATGHTAPVLDSLKKWIRERFGDRVDATTPEMVQYCMISMTPDEDYMIDFLGGEWGKKVVIAGGFSGHGFKMAPAVARILVDLAISGETKVADMKHFELARFEKNPKGNIKDYGHRVDLVN